MPKRAIRIGREQLRALSNATRLDLYTSLRTDGPGTARELATRLGADEMKLYYHLRRMRALGLISAKMRPSATKPEAVFSVLGHLIVDDLDLRDETNLKEVCRNVESVLKAAAREYRAAAVALRNELHDQTEIRRLAGRLTPEKQLELRRRLTDLTQWLDENNHAEGGRYTLTLALVPFVRR